METKFKALTANEDDRVQRNVRQAEERREADAAKQQLQRAEEWAAICRSRDQQLALKAARKEQALCEDKDFTKAWKVWPRGGYALLASAELLCAQAFILIILDHC
jgi:hypothetical protein